MRFSLRSIFWTISTVAVILGVGLWLKRTGHERHLHDRNYYCLKLTYLALASHDEARKKLPPPVFRDLAGKALSSWRFRVSPWMCFRAEFDRHWRDPANRIPAVQGKGFFCVDPSNSSGCTDVFAVAGAGTAFDASVTRRLSDLPPDLIIAIVTADTKCHWMEPGDFDVDELSQRNGTLAQNVPSPYPGRVYVLFADGKIWSLRGDTPMDVFKEFLTIERVVAQSRDDSLGPYAIFSETKVH